jgi:hypothetical protein
VGKVKRLKKSIDVAAERPQAISLNFATFEPLAELASKSAFAAQRVVCYFLHVAVPTHSHCAPGAFR